MLSRPKPIRDTDPAIIHNRRPSAWTAAAAGHFPFLTKNGIQNAVVPNAVDFKILELIALFPHTNFLQNP